jgi:hypothetical protein
VRALAFWKEVTVDRAGFLEAFLEILNREGVRFAVIGGQGVNAYAEPVVSLDLDLVVAQDQLEGLSEILGKRFRVESFPHSLNVSDPSSDLRIQLQTDPRYSEFVHRAALRTVLGLPLPVADLKDVLQGKIWAATDASRRPSKRLKDLADIARLVEGHPELRELVPREILERIY